MAIGSIEGIMNNHTFKNIICEKDNETGIVQITLNRPEIKNALTMVLLLELYDAVIWRIRMMPSKV